MSPDVVIVGDRARSAELLGPVRALGYVAELRPAEPLESLLAGGPAVLLIDLRETRVRPLLAKLRADSPGAAAILLYGELGGEVRDLADLLELGADRLLGAPLDEAELGAALAEHLGAAAGAAPVRGEPEPPRVDPAAPDPLLAKLRRTLAALEEHHDAAEPRADEDLDLDAMGLDALPRLAAPAADADLADLALEGGDAVTRAVVRPNARAAAPHSTLRLDDAAPSSRVAVEADDGGDTGRAAPRRLTDPRGLPALLWGLHRAAFTGRVRVGRSAAPLDLWLVDGEPCHCEPQGDLLGDLARRGLLSAAQVDEARARGGLDLRDLVGRGWLRPREAAQAAGERLRAVLAEVLVDPCVDVFVHAGERPSARSRLSVGVAALIAEAIVDGLELPELWRRLGSGDRRPRWRASGERALAALADLAELPGMDLTFPDLDGRRTLAELVADGGRDLLAALHVLEVLGHIELDDPADPAAAAIDRQRIVARLALASAGAAHELLGLAPGAAPAAVRRAHRALCRTFAPERQDPAVAAELAVELDELRAAFDRARAVLLDPTP